MSVRFRLVNMFESSVRKRFADRVPEERTRRGLPMKREPKTTSACPSRIGWMSRGYSRGSYSRSASWMTTMSPVACPKPVRSAAPLPWFRSWQARPRAVVGRVRRLARDTPRARRACRPCEQSSTTMISFASGTARTRSRSCARCRPRCRPAPGPRGGRRRHRCEIVAGPPRHLKTLRAGRCGPPLDGQRRSRLVPAPCDPSPRLAASGGSSPSWLLGALVACGRRLHHGRRHARAPMAPERSRYPTPCRPGATETSQRALLTAPGVTVESLTAGRRPEGLGHAEGGRPRGHRQDEALRGTSTVTQDGGGRGRGPRRSSHAAAAQDLNDRASRVRRSGSRCPARSSRRTRRRRSTARTWSGAYARRLDRPANVGAHRALPCREVRRRDGQHSDPGSEAGRRAQVAPRHHRPRP